MKEIPLSFPAISGIVIDPARTKISALEYLNWFKREFDKQLLAYLSEKKSAAVEINTETAVLVEEIRRFSENGGKRVRPAFMFSGYVAAGGQAYEAILFATLSVELLHTFALIHDDIIDNSSLRRGELTTHKQFEKIHKEKNLQGNGKEYGLSSAILAGDLALSFAEEILTSAPFPQERLRRARYFFDQMKMQVLYGEYLDVLGGFQKSLNEDQVLQILEYKTAKYTVERPLHIGAVLAGADFEILETFSRYGIPFGQAFQMQDDLVGSFASEKEIGKPSDSDIKEGKKTLLLVKAYERATKSQKKILDAVVGNKNSSQEEVDKVRKIMKETGSYDYCLKLSKQLLIQAEEALKDQKLKEEGRWYLLKAIEYLEERL